MSDDVDQEQRTEAPSGRRMADATAQGDIPIGHDVAPVVALTCAVIAMMVLGPALRSALSVLFAEVTRAVDRTPFASLPSLLGRPVALSLAICAASAGGAMVATLAQTKGTFFTAKLEPDLGRLWGGVKLFKIFTKDFAIDIGLSVLKVVAIGGAAWLAIRADFARLPQMLGAEPAAELSWTFTLVATAAKPVLGVILLIAAIDLFVTRWRYLKKMKMTKPEAKREAKDDDGDPAIRGKRRKRHREIVAGKVRWEVPRADALVVNPTHIAICLRYRKDEGRAPRVTAKGKGILAEHMRALARENGVPIVEDIPLARLLYRKVKVGREIPAATYKAVATILAFVYRVTGRSPGAAGRPAGRAIGRSAALT
jgi:flagellar biosynthesis protein FlhB